MSSVNLFHLQVYAFGQAGCNPPQKPDEVKQYIDDLGSKDQKNGWRIRLRGEEGLLRVLRSNERLEKKFNIINELLKNLASKDYEKQKTIIRILVILLRSEKSDSPLFSEASLRQRIADSFIRIFDQSAWGIKELIVSGLSTLVKKGLSDELSSKAFFLLIASAKDTNWRIKAASIESLQSFFKSDLITLNLQRQIEAKKNEVIPILIAVTKDQHSVGIVKLEVARLFIKLGAREQAIPALIAVLNEVNSLDNWSIREAAAKALGELKAREAVQGLVYLLKDNHFYVRIAAAQALIKLQKEQTIPALMEACKDSNAEVKVAALEALGRLKAKQAIGILLEALKDNNEKIRRVAAFALKELGERGAVEGLIEALKDQDFEVKRIAAEALGKLKIKEAISGLVVLLEDKIVSVRIAAVGALLDILEPMQSNILLLLAALKDKDIYVRQETETRLQQIKIKEIISGFAKALKEGNAQIRLRIVNILIELKTKEAIPALIVALKDGNWFIRLGAALALEELKAREAIPALIVALKDGENVVRIVAARALGKLQAKEAIPALIAALRDNDSKVSEAAAEALRKIRAAHQIKSK